MAPLVHLDIAGDFSCAFALTYCMPVQGMMWFADLAIDCIFMIDVALNFRTAFVVNGMLSLF